jgi:hypothetical protein
VTAFSKPLQEALYTYICKNLTCVDVTCRRYIVGIFNAMKCPLQISSGKMMMFDERNEKGEGEVGKGNVLYKDTRGL